MTSFNSIDESDLEKKFPSQFLLKEKRNSRGTETNLKPINNN